MIAVVVATLATLLAFVICALIGQRRKCVVLEAHLQSAECALEHLQETCSQFAPAGVVQRLVVERPTEESSPVAERKVVTALFADIVGYTSLSERLEPAALARLLDGYFQRTSDAIREYRGHVSTFLGDGVLAYFGALQPNPWQSDDAVSAALAIREAIRAYNEELRRDGLPELAVGVGIHRGPGLVGLIGSRERKEYGFVGRTVNVAARVQSLTRIHGVDILITDAIRVQLDSRFQLRALPAERVSGIAEPLVTYGVDTDNAARS
jgi:adenylate cyclase